MLISGIFAVCERTTAVSKHVPLRHGCCGEVPGPSLRWEWWIQQHAGDNGMRPALEPWLHYHCMTTDSAPLGSSINTYRQKCGEDYMGGEFCVVLAQTSEHNVHLRVLLTWKYFIILIWIC